MAHFLAGVGTAAVSGKVLVRTNRNFGTGSSKIVRHPQRGLMCVLRAAAAQNQEGERPWGWGTGWIYPKVQSSNK